MIKGNVTLCGKISHAATLRPNKKGEVYTNFNSESQFAQWSGKYKRLLCVCPQKGGDC